MIPEWKLFLKTLAFPTKQVFAIALALALILFLPAFFLDRLGLSDFRQQYHPYLGGTFLLLASVLLVRGCIAAASRMREKRRKRALLRRAQERLHALTIEEREILRVYIARQTKTQILSPECGVVAGLVGDKIIYLSAQFGRIDGVAHNIQPWAWNYLNQHPELVTPLLSDKKLG